MISIDSRIDAARAAVVGEGKSWASRRYSSARISLPTRRTPASSRCTRSRSESVTLGTGLIAETKTFASSRIAGTGVATGGPPRLATRRGRVFRSRERVYLGFDLRDERGQIDSVEFLADAASELLRVQPLEPQAAVLSFDEEELGPGSDALRFSSLLRDHDPSGAVDRHHCRHQWYRYHLFYIMVSTP